MSIRHIGKKVLRASIRLLIVASLAGGAAEVAAELVSAVDAGQSQVVASSPNGSW